MSPPLADTGTVTRLLALYRRVASDHPEYLGREPWYRREGRKARAMAILAGVDPDRAVIALAVLSPATTWESLTARFLGFLRAFAYGDLTPPTMPGYRANVVRAWRALSGDYVPTARGAPKVSRFALNLSGRADVVTLDRWALRVAGLPETLGIRQYRAAEMAYRAAATTAGVDPSRFQAVLWEAVREGTLAWGGAS